MASAAGAASAGRRRRVLNSLSSSSPCNELQQSSKLGVPLRSSSANKESICADLMDGYKKCLEAKSKSECTVLIKDHINAKHSDSLSGELEDVIK